MTQQRPQKTNPQHTPEGGLLATDGGFIWHPNTVLEPGLVKTATKNPLKTNFDRAARDRGKGVQPKLRRGLREELTFRELQVKRHAKIHAPTAWASRGHEPGGAQQHRSRRVRRGGRNTSVHVNRPVALLSAFRARLSRRAESSSPLAVWRNYFQKGALVGLMLGCISMVLFHQVAIPASVSTLTGAGTPSEPAVVNLSSRTELSVILPNVKAFVLKFGPYTTKTAAVTVLKTLQQSGRAAAIVQDSSGFEVWDGVALSSQAAQTAFDVSKLTASSGKPSLQSLTWPATPLQTTTVVSRQGTTAVSKWLASLASVLTVETGVVSNETTYRDASQALQNADKQLPPASVWANGSTPTLFAELNRSVSTALSLLAKKQNGQAEQQILSAWIALAALKNQVFTGS